MELSELRHGTELLKRGFAAMQKGGVIMDVVNADQARIAEEAGAVAVMSLERVPSDIRKAGGVARMADPPVERLADFGQLKVECSRFFQEYSDIKEKIAQLTGIVSSRERELDLLRHQIHELNQVKLTEENYNQVEQQLQRVNNAAKIYELAAAAVTVFDDGEQGITQRLIQAFSPLRGLMQIDGQTSGFLANLERIQSDSEELLLELRRYLERSSFPGRGHRNKPTV